MCVLLGCKEWLSGGMLLSRTGHAILSPVQNRAIPGTPDWSITDLQKDSRAYWKVPNPGTPCIRAQNTRASVIYHLAR